ncbi:hypothetical protein HDU97_001712 [Phlyctochytrium planicorne]|nr:hypothetical protein HDU97_001712 [Phlyctochytrium planicorne]
MVDDVGLEILGRFVDWIVALNLSYLFKLTDAGVKRLFRMKGLVSLNLMGCCRIKSYPWAIANDHPRATLPVKEISIGEDSRIQTRGFWLLWCTWQQWDMGKIVRICPFLETLRLNMVLFDLPAPGLEILLQNSPNLKTLSLVADRNLIPGLCTAAPLLAKLTSLDLTIHIGVTMEHFSTLVRSGALKKLKALKFHSKHTNVFGEESLREFVDGCGDLEHSQSSVRFLEMNGEDLHPDSLVTISPRLGKNLQSLLMHHFYLSNESLNALSQNCTALRELTINDIQPLCVPNKSRSVSTKLGEADSMSSMRNVSGIKNLGKYKVVEGDGTAINRLSMVVQDKGMAMRLKKLEMSSSMIGFKDKDLAEIPLACKNLQWADFQFPFTFPLTTKALASNCSNLLFLRLARTSLPTSTGASPANRPSTAPPAPRRTSEPNTMGPQPPVVSNTPPRRGRSGRRRQSASPTLGTSSNLSNSSEITSSKPRGFLCSSPETQSLLFLSDSSKSVCAKKIRVLDVTGDIGLSDHVLSKGFSRLPALHTVFLDSVEGVSEKGVRGFAEGCWKSLKRLHIRNCRGCRIGVVTENYVTKGLEVDLVVDGGRVLGSSNRFADGDI